MIFSTREAETCRGCVCTDVVKAGGKARHELSRRGLLVTSLCAGAVFVINLIQELRSPKRSAKEGGATVLRPRGRDGLVAVPEAEGTLLITEGGQGVSAAYGCRLNPVAGLIWSLSDGTRSVDELACEVASRCGVPSETARADTHAFIEALTQQGLLTR
jgi:hypothetical protein